MSLVTKSSGYAPDIFKALSGLLLVCKPTRLSTQGIILELKERIADSLNHYEPRPIAKRLEIVGDTGSEKRVVEVPNLADHPLVAGPRYMPWEIKIASARPRLGYHSSGLEVLLLGAGNKYYGSRLRLGRLVSVYHLTGKFGHITDNHMDDGKIIDKTTFHHIRPHKIDAALARVESSQHHRLFDSAAVPLDSQVAYELAKSWPSRPPTMATWPVIYRIRCIHLQLPIFKLEVTCVNESEHYLAHIVNDLGLMLKSGAHTQTIKRVRLGPFDLSDSLTDKDWNLPSIVEHLKLISSDSRKMHSVLKEQIESLEVRTEHRPEYLGPRHAKGEPTRRQLDFRQAGNRIAIQGRY